MQILHITDLHYRSAEPFQTALIEALLADLKGRVADGFSPDFIVFSGDIVNDPDEAGIYEDFEAKFLKPVLDASRLVEREVIFCPGNHDVSRAKLKEWSDQRANLVGAMADYESVKKLFKTEPYNAYIKAISSGFFALTDRCGASWPNPFVHRYSFPTKKVSFIAINSAVCCGSEGSKFDRGKLVIVADQVLSAFQAVPEGHQVFSSMHHTFGDVSEVTSRHLIPLIEQRSALHLFGHVHDPRPTVEMSPSGRCFTLQGGALYEDQGIYNGYSLVSTGPGPDRIAAEYRTYYPGRHVFDVGINVAEKGIFYSSDASKSYWQNLTPTPNNDDVCLWLMETADAVIKERDTTLTERSLLETFIEPVLSRSAGPSDPASGQIVGVTHLLEAQRNIVLSCEPEFGATALLSYVAMRFHHEPLALEKALAPAFIDARQIRRSYSAAVASLLRGELPESEDSRLKLQPLHESGRLVILVDNIDPGNTLHVEFLTTLRKDYPKARLIVAVKMPLMNADVLKPVIGIEEFEFLRLKPLTRGKLRTLVEKWKLPSRYQMDSVVEEIYSKFIVLGIPLTPVYVVIYLAVLQDIHGYNPINSSTVIEQFIESALEKYKPVYVFRSSFDYRNQIDYLAAMSERMCRLNKFTVGFEELYNWTKEYFAELGLEHDYQKLISHFVDNRVFGLEGNSIYFRYNIFESFFIAYRMLRSEEFKQWVLTDYRYTNYITEIDIYCGLSRQDLSMIEFFSTEFSNLTGRLEEYIKPLAWTDRLEKLTLPAVKKDEIEAFTDGINKQLLSMDTQTRDEAISTQQPTRDVRPDPERAEIVGLLPNWILTLRSYTVALKNLENISKVKKEEHLHRILAGWSTVMLYACMVFKEVIEKPVLQIGNTKFTIELPKALDARLLRALFLAIPVFISDWVRRDLGSQKLELQLRNDDLAPGLTESFLQTGLYADLKLNEYLGRLAKFKDRVERSESRFFLEVMLLKMRDIFLRLGLQHEERESFLHLAAELSAEIKGLRGDEKKREIDRYMAELARQDHIQRIRENIG